MRTKTKLVNFKITQELKQKMIFHKQENSINWTALLTHFIEDTIQKEEILAKQIEEQRAKK